MLSGRPVINAVEAAGNPIDLSGCGMSIPAEDSGEIAAAVSRMMAMTPAERDEMGERGRQYVVKNHEYSVLAARFIEALQAL